MGLKLKNPIIAASSGMTESVEKVRKLAEAGAGAVVLKSLFEEQIRYESDYSVTENEQLYYFAQAEDYIRDYTRGNELREYLDLISACKDAVDIPVIASLNCVSASGWTDFAAQIQRSGADALELNMFILPSDPQRDSAQNEQVYFDILKKVTADVSLPVSAKISYYSAGLASVARKLSSSGINGLVLFNRFFSPDIDIDTFEIKSSNVFSSPDELALSLRWVAMLSSMVPCDIAASTGIHSAEALIKQLLAGARAGQIASVLYHQGPGVIGSILTDLEAYMKRHGFSSVREFNGRMSLHNTDNPAAWERVQFMKYFSDIR